MLRDGRPYNVDFVVIIEKTLDLYGLNFISPSVRSLKWCLCQSY